MDPTSESTVAETRTRGRGPIRPKRSLPTLTVLAHPNPMRIGDMAVLGELVSGHAVQLARLKPDFKAPGSLVSRPLGDRHLSRRPLSISAEGDSLQFSATSTPTTVRINGEEVTASSRIPAAALEEGIVIELGSRIVLLLHRHTPRPSGEDQDHFELDASMGLIGHSDGLVHLRHEIRQVAALTVPVLIRGETGTGKELVARALHEQSQRADGPFVDVNLGALPPSLAANELFGAERGAFTGSTRSHAGCFGRAEGGTLFLDEVGEAPAEIQVALLRALETGEIHPLGSGRPRRVDVRVIAATDADLDGKIADGSFREPLLHRLAGYELFLPALRQRREDIGRLMIHFLRLEDAELGRGSLRQERGSKPFIDGELMQRLVRFAWPGNVRQFRNAVRQLAIGNRDPGPLNATPNIERLLGGAKEESIEVTKTWVGDSLLETGSDGEKLDRGSQAGDTPPPKGPRRGPARISDDEIVEALRRHRFEIKAAAEELGFSRAALYKWIEESPRIRTVGQLDEQTLREAHRDLGGDLEALVDRLEVSRFALRRRLRELGLG